MPFSSQDLLLAQEVQSAAIPPSAPALAGMEIAIRAVSAQGIGGDFHLILRPPDDRDVLGQVGVVVGDVSGKSLPASLIATSIGHLLPLLDPLRDPASALHVLNDALLERTPLESYASLVLAQINARSGLIRIWSAGHPPTILWRSRFGEVVEARMGNLPLGCYVDWRGDPQEFSWEVGDILVLYSDGLIETRNQKGEMFEIAGVTEILRRFPNGSAEEIVEALMQAANDWGTVTDDITVLVCKRTMTAPPQSVEPVLVRVLLVDDHCIWRDGMRSLLNGTEFQVVGEAASGHAVLEAIRQIKPDLVLLDIRMADGDGLDALGTIREQAPGTRVLMVTTYDHPHYKARALAAGAVGYVLKGTPREEMLAALRAAMESATPPNAKEIPSAHLATAAKMAEYDDVITPLTSREAEVLSLLSTGRSNHDIGEQLFISEGTVKTHVEHIITKLGVSDRVQAAVWAARHDLAPEVILPCPDDPG
jgi:DNA-binding NarL/FixJ family response regulator